MTHKGCGGRVEEHPNLKITVPMGGDGFTGPERLEHYPRLFCRGCGAEIIGDCQIVESHEEIAGQ